MEILNSDGGLINAPLSVFGDLCSFGTFLREEMNVN